MVSGKTIERNIRIVPAPLILALSSNSLLIEIMPD
jgi:hypothetical protein